MNVDLRIPGCGKNWVLSYDVTEWLCKHSPDANLRWHGMHSDNATITFELSEDATAFKLRFPEWT